MGSRWLHSGRKRHRCDMGDIFEGAAAPLTADGFNGFVTRLGLQQPRDLWAIVLVETSGFGFLPDRRPKILYERHVFHNRTGGRFSAQHPDISNSIPGGYQGGAAEYLRLKRAMALDAHNALCSASWGLGQVMGFNAAKIGYGSVETMVQAFKEGEDAQLAGAVAFIEATNALLGAVRQRQWARVAYFYNGKDYAAKGYDKKLADAHEKCSLAGPNFDTRAKEAYLAYLGERKPAQVRGTESDTDDVNRAVTAFLDGKEVAGDTPLDKLRTLALGPLAAGTAVA